MPSPAAPPHAPTGTAARLIRLIRLIRCVLTGLGAAACVTFAAAPGTETAPGWQAAPIHVSVAVVPITGTAPFNLALQRGYFVAALASPNTFPTSRDAVQVQPLANLMAEGGMLARPLNVASLVFR